MNLAAIVGAAVALVPPEVPILELVWVPAPRRPYGRASCYVRTAAGWTHLYGQVGRRGLPASRSTDPFLDRAAPPGLSSKRDQAPRLSAVVDRADPRKVLWLQLLV